MKNGLVLGGVLSGRPRLLLIAVAVGVAVLAVGGSILLRAGGAERAAAAAQDRPVSMGEAKALLERTVRLARAGEYDRICETLTDQPGSCRRLLADARASGYGPGAEPPTVNGSSRTKHSLILHMHGQRGQGDKLYGADFAVTRDATGRAVAYTPIYWSGVLVDAERITSCSQRLDAGSTGVGTEASCGADAPPIRQAR